MRNRKVTIGIVIALVFAVVSLGIAFAAFSTTLNINGSASVESSNWNVYFTTDYDNPIDPGTTGISLTNANMTKDGTAQNVSTTLTSNTFTWSATVKAPGDYISYQIVIYNTGDYDADLTFSNVISNHGVLTCTQNGVVTSEASAVCSHLDYGVELDGCDINSGYYDECVLQNNDFKVLTIALFSSYNGWAQDGSDLPKNPVTVTAAPIVLTATQSSSAH